MNKQEIIRRNIIADLSEGVMAIRYNGRIEIVNDAARKILGMQEAEERLEGRPFASFFFSDERNDAFTQTVLDTIYGREKSQESYVTYYTEDTEKHLRIVSSYLRDEEELIGIVLVISDISELTRMRDAIKAMEAIRALNQKLELRNRLLKETFGRYLSDDIVREILDTPDGMKMGGQRRRITIMMSDLRGFTMMCERMEAASVVTMLNHYFACMYEEIEKYGGTIIEFLGDGMFIIFGAPVEKENHAKDAVAAAIAMQNRMKEVNEWNASHGYEQLSMGIGINTDEVILGNIGSERRTKYGVMGSAVNLTGRIESYTTDGQILISEAVRAELGEDIRIRGELKVSPKGVKHEISLFDISGIGAPYHIRKEEHADTAAELLEKPVKIKFAVLDGKHAGSFDHTCFITALSDDMVCISGGSVNVFDNILIDEAGGIYAKAVRAEDCTAELVFTGKPAGFRQWKEDLLNEK